MKINNHLIIIDQHAADERVKLECYLQNFQLKKEEAIQFQLSISIKHYEIWLLHSKKLLKSGFWFEKTEMKQITCSGTLTLSRDCIQITSHLAIDVFLKCLDWYSQHPNSFPSIEPPILDYLKSKACRTAIMFGDTLSIEQCTNLIRDLNTTDLPFQCAHGRPSMIPITTITPHHSLHRNVDLSRWKMTNISIN
jgi:DNA mismatch repair protein MLH3